jgi:hypothetical protein
MTLNLLERTMLVRIFIGEDQEYEDRRKPPSP